MFRSRIAAALALIAWAHIAWAQIAWAQASPGKVLDIAGRTSEIGGRTLDILGLASEVKGADLGIAAVDLGIPGSHVAVTGKEVRIELPADILFDFDKADIRPSAADALKKAAALLRAHAKGVVRVEGHTDSKGKPAYNQKLSERRAEAVRRWLVEREGLTAVRYAIQGFGATRPKVPNARPDGSDDPQGRQINRRVEIVFATG